MQIVLFKDVKKSEDPEGTDLNVNSILSSSFLSGACIILYSLSSARVCTHSVGTMLLITTGIGNNVSARFVYT